MKVVRAMALNGHRLLLEFSDGSQRIFDVTPYLYGPVFEPLKDEAYFKQLKVDHRLGVWFKSAPLGVEKCDLEQ